MTTFYVIRKAVRMVKPYTRTRKGKLEHVGGYSAEWTEAERMRVELKREKAREWIRMHRERMKSLKGEMDKVKIRESEIAREEAVIEKHKDIPVPKVSTKAYFEAVLEIKRDYFSSRIDRALAWNRLVEVGINEDDVKDLLKRWGEELATGKKEQAPEWMKPYVKETPESPEDTKRKKELEAEKKELEVKKKKIEEKAKVEAEETSFIRMGATKSKKLAKEALGAEKDLSIGGSVGTVKGYEAVMPGMEEFPEVDSLGKVWIWKNEKTGFWDARNAGTKEWLVRSSDKILSAAECYNKAYAKLEEVMGPRLAEAKEAPIYDELTKTVACGALTGEKYTDKDTGKFGTVTRARADGIEVKFGVVGLIAGERKTFRPSEFIRRFERVPDAETAKLDDKLHFGGLKSGDMVWGSDLRYGLVTDIGADKIDILWRNHEASESISLTKFMSDTIKVYGYKKLQTSGPPTIATLTEEQTTAIEFQGRGNEPTEEHVKYIAGKYAISEADVHRVMEGIKKVPLIVNRWMYFTDSGRSFPDIFVNGKLKNQFQLRELATSSGSLDPHKEGGRDRWERVYTGGALHRSKEYTSMKSSAYFTEDVASERPIYGHWDYTEGGAGGYGNIQLVLKDEVKGRTGYAIGNSSGIGHIGEVPKSAGTFKNPMSFVETIVKDYKKGTIKPEDWKKILEGKKYPTRSAGFDYIEAQIYGGVDIRRDVEKIIIKKGRGDESKTYAHIFAMGKKYGIKVIKPAS